MSIQEETIAANGIMMSAATLDVESEQIKFDDVNRTNLAWLDVIDGLKKWPIWLMLAYQDIKLRYRRSVLGPFWLTISMAITVYSMGFLYSRLFHTELSTYFPFLVAGMLGWSLISTIVMELTDGLTASESLIKQIKLPYTLYIHRIVCRNILIFFHNIFVIFPIMIIYPETTRINFNTLLLIPGLLVIYLNAITFGMVLAMIGARYRDIAQIIKSLVQVIFFITPVMWGPDILNASSHWIVDLNPFYAFLQLIRCPLLGNLPTLKNIIPVAVISVIGLSISWTMLVRYRARIVYWL